MELQDSVAFATNPSLPLVGLWDRLKSNPDSRADSFGSEHAAALPGNSRHGSGRAWTYLEKTEKQASSDDEFSAHDESFAPQSGNDYARASDDQLLAAAKACDALAFEELSGRYVKAMRKRVYSIVRNPEDTEDAVQDSLLKAYRHLQDFRKSCDFSTWITRIAINTALMVLRKRKWRREVSFDQTGEADQTWGMWDIPDPSPNTEQAYARREALEFMSRAVKRLPATYRSVLEQYHTQEKSLSEAADKLGITVASAKSRLFRARRKLRSRLEGQRISAFDACY